MANEQRVWDLIVVGGGAAGFFGAANVAERYPEKTVIILEASTKVLSKVLVSGGGRCNVTHACFDNAELVLNYPRGEKEMRGPFSRFSTGDCFAWFEEHGVSLKIESDNRAFPESNSSQTIADCLYQTAVKHGVQVELSSPVEAIDRNADVWELSSRGKAFRGKNILWATGSKPSSYKILETLGVNCVERVPSLFSFNLKDPQLVKLAGISVPYASCLISKSKFESHGPLLITHWGLSGPCILKLSAFAARHVRTVNYKFNIEVNWLNQSKEELFDHIWNWAEERPNQKISNPVFPELPKRLWKYFLACSKLNEDTNWQDMSKQQVLHLCEILSEQQFSVDGKTTYKEEFVTAGGIALTEVNLKTMELKNFPKFYVAGEVMDVDAVTGGFNFQHAWTSSWIAAQNIFS
ncbi:MAG: NAD(P)/FAD-dependent oxidoreductase [Luteibaculum sp.]